MDSQPLIQFRSRGFQFGAHNPDSETKLKFDNLEALFNYWRSISEVSIRNG